MRIVQEVVLHEIYAMLVRVCALGITLPHVWQQHHRRYKSLVAQPCGIYRQSVAGVANDGNTRQYDLHTFVENATEEEIPVLPR